VSRPLHASSGAPSPGSTGPEDGLPEPAPLPVARRLLEVARRIAPREIGELWIFPPLPEVEASAEFLVLTRYVADGRLRLYTARKPGPLRPEGDRSAVGEERPRTEAIAARADPTLDEELRAHGEVPADRVPRLLERFQRRVGTEHDFVHVRVEGSEIRWRALVRAAEAEEPGSPVTPEPALDVDGGVANP